MNLQDRASVGPPCFLHTLISDYQLNLQSFAAVTCNLHRLKKAGEGSNYCIFSYPGWIQRPGGNVGIAYVIKRMNPNAEKNTNMSVSATRLSSDCPCLHTVIHDCGDVIDMNRMERRRGVTLQRES